MNWLNTLIGNEMLLLGAIVGLLSILVLSVLRYDLTVFICFCLLGFVKIEPAPFDALIMVLCVVGLLTGNLSLKALRGSSSIHFLLWVFLVANLASFVGAISSGSASSSLRFLAITIYLIMFVYFIKMYVTSLRAMRIVMIGYLGSALLNALLVILGFLGISPFHERFLEFGIRAVGGFKDPNVFGPFFVSVILLLIDEILHPRLLPRYFLAKVLGVIVLTTVTFLSFSRGAWANLALAVAVYTLLNANRVLQINPRNVIIGGIPLLLIVIGGWQAFDQLFEKLGIKEFLMWRISSHDYDVVRFNRQKAGLEAGLMHVFGLGPGTWDHAHSLYVRTFTEHGILGFVSLLGLLAVLTAGVFRRAFSEIREPYGLSAKVVLSCLVGLAVNSLVIDTVHWRHLWLILGLAWVISTQPSCATRPAS